MAKKPKKECAVCARYGSEDCDDCDKRTKDLFMPKFQDDVKVSVNGSEPKPIGSTESMKEIEKVVEKHVPKQVDLEMRPIPELEDEDETEVIEYQVMRCKGFIFRMKTEAFDKLMTKNKGESA
ncbi:MAG: hypothetical protein WC375_08740, partial [Methanomassiliicoccales archaeon]